MEVRRGRLSDNATRLVPYAAAAAVILTLLVLNRGFWEDEAWLALGISGSTLAGLFKPLPDGQVAPIGFVLLERLSITIFGNFDWAFRIVPALASLLIVDQVRRLPAPESRRVLFLALLFLNPMVLRYTVEAKQYIFDVLLAVALLRVMLGERPTRAFIVLAAGVWFSNIAFIAALPVAVVIAPRRQRLARIDLIYIASCVASLAAYYGMFVHGHGNREYMVHFWEQNGGLYAGGSIVRFAANAIELVAQGFSPVYDVFQRLGLRPFAAVAMVALIAAGLSTDIGRLLALCVIVHVTFSMLGVYPVAQRLTLYMVPLTLWLIVRLELRRLVWIALIALTGLAFTRRPVFPFASDDTRRYLGTLHSTGVDSVYTVGGATAVARYYSQSLGYGMHVTRVWRAAEILNPNVPLLIVSHEYSNFDPAFLARYDRIEELKSPLGISLTSRTGLFMPRSPQADPRPEHGK
jgi:hypothetical protein